MFLKSVNLRSVYVRMKTTLKRDFFVILSYLSITTEQYYAHVFQSNMKSGGTYISVCHVK